MKINLNSDVMGMEWEFEEGGGTIVIKRIITKQVEML